ncbi:hypothetical protein C8Q78DRAFT_269176 [Trametes maxima]|nr:hypothetical protein C8Q78DRAFT_269176 [Trametes maxima]
MCHLLQVRNASLQASCSRDLRPLMCFSKVDLGLALSGLSCCHAVPTNTQRPSAQVVAHGMFDRKPHPRSATPINNHNLTRPTPFPFVSALALDTLRRNYRGHHIIHEPTHVYPVCPAVQGPQTHGRRHPGLRSLNNLCAVLCSSSILSHSVYPRWPFSATVPVSAAHSHSARDRRASTGQISPSSTLPPSGMVAHGLAPRPRRCSLGLPTGL